MSRHRSAETSVAKLFPVAPEYLQDIKTISVFDAVLISLGIEPASIHELIGLARLEIINPMDPFSGLDDQCEYPTFDLGELQPEFEQRIERLRQAVSSGTVRRIGTSAKIEFSEFKVWAEARGWQLPSSAKVAKKRATKAVMESFEPTKKSNNSSTIEPRIYRIQGVIKLTGLSRSTIYALMTKGKFPARVSLGGKNVGWKADDLNRWLEERPNPSGSQAKG